MSCEFEKPFLAYVVSIVTISSSSNVVFNSSYYNFHLSQYLHIFFSDLLMFLSLSKPEHLKDSLSTRAALNSFCGPATALSPNIHCDLGEVSWRYFCLPRAKVFLHQDNQKAGTCSCKFIRYFRKFVVLSIFQIHSSD